MAAKKGRKKGKKTGGSKAALSRKRGHKPVALLRQFRNKMARNIHKLDVVIERRERAGE